MQFKNILMACDFSDSSRQAFQLACLMRETYQATLHLVHVFNPGIFDVPLPYHMPSAGATWTSDQLQQVRNQGQSALDKLANEIEDTKTALVEGQPGPALVRYAKENTIDLIILGSHGYGGLDRLLLGSVALYVSAHAEPTVITVKPGQKGESTAK